MKAAWIAPFVLAFAVTPVLAADTSNSPRQQSQTQGSVSPNAINPGQGKQPDGHTVGGENQQHTDDFGSSRITDAEGDTDTSANTGSDHDTDADDGASASGGSSAESGASADNGTNTDS